MRGGTDRGHRSGLWPESVLRRDTANGCCRVRITNLGDIPRRFDIDATVTDSMGVEAPLIPQDTNWLVPRDSSVEQTRIPVIDDDVPPYSCSAKVSDSVLDTAFPND